ncbi:MAG TPA: Gfo/Idh/MocA family oxidoreductase, partial [Blastocatellia bacterium]|nr:Gfo/Idh/MocA family oxidoreductase [Blastocatellia bacterium]
MKSRNRRQFLKESMGAVGAVGAAASINTLSSTEARGQSAQSQDKTAGANDRIRAGLIGCGGQGRADLSKMLKMKGIECVALCDVDDAQSQRALKMVGTEAAQTPALVTRDFRKVLDQKDVDVVIIGTPDHWHAIPTVM